MNHAPLNAPSSRRRVLLPSLLLLAAALLGLGCPRTPKPASLNLVTPDLLAAAQSSGSATEYRLDSQPFSPTLPFLFDQARILVLPAQAAPSPPPGIAAESYAFSAIDRFGRLYHFDKQLRWWMAAGETLPEPLPAADWSAAWNPQQGGAPELLVTAPWAGQGTIQVLRWRAGNWSSVNIEKAPPARQGAVRLFHAAQNRWLLVGGSLDGKPLSDGWTIEGTAWTPWAGAAADDKNPPLDKVLRLMDGPEGSAPILMTRSGAIWIWKARKWRECGTVKVENLSLAQFVPALGQVLFVWTRGRGQDQFLWQTIDQIVSGSTSMPQSLTPTGLVRVNDRDEGQWKGWGRAHAKKDAIGQTLETLTPGFEGEGEPAILIGTADHDKTIRRSQINMLELPPALDSLRFEAAAWVPALDGLVIPSVCGIGLNARREPFFPPEAWDTGTTSETQPRIDVLEHGYRFWIFKAKSLDWLKPPYEINPDIGYPSTAETADGRRRYLAWTFPEPGMIRYDFHEIHDKKIQWINSPRLTIKGIPQLALTPDDEIFLCDPIIWGDPAELVVVGWCGKLGEHHTFQKTVAGLDDEAYTALPNRGFMARTLALDPQQWQVTTLPIPFCQGAQLVTAPERGSIYLMGGKSFEEKVYNNKKLFFPRSQNLVWQWDGESWRAIAPQEGVQPRMKATLHVVYDPASRLLLSLTPRALYGFESDAWHCLWQVPKAHNAWPDDVALYLHPQSRLILGAWFMPRLNLRAWQGSGWVPIRIADRLADGSLVTTATMALRVREPGGPLPNVADNLLPATQPDCFVSLDADALNAMRMDAPRDRSRDRLRGAWWLTFKPANAGPIAYGMRPLGETMPSGTASTSPTLQTQPVAVAAASTTPTQAAVAASPPSSTQTRSDLADDGPASSTLRIIAGDDGKIVKKNQTGILLRRLESLDQ